MILFLIHNGTPFTTYYGVYVQYYSVSVCVCVPELSAIVSSWPVCMGSAVWPVYVCKQNLHLNYHGI